MQKLSTDKPVTVGTAQWLYAKLAGECPELGSPDTGEWETVCALRQWACENTNIATAGALLGKAVDRNFYKKPVHKMFGTFSRNEGGVWCGGFSRALRDLYRSCGFVSEDVHSGFPGLLTHVSTRVTIKHKNRKIRVLQDSYFNSTYTDSDGEPLDFDDLVTRVSKGRSDEIRTVSPAYRAQDLIVHPEDISGLDTYTTIDIGPLAETLPSGLRRYKSRMRKGQDFARCFPKAMEALQEHGLTPELINLYAFVSTP